MTSIHSPEPSRWRRRHYAPLAAIALGALALSAGLAACDDDDEAGPDEDVGTVQTQDPDETPDDGVGTPTVSTAGTPGSEDSDELPDNAEDYATMAFEAWEENDMDVLEELTSDEALEVFESRPADATEEWTAVGCDAGAGSAFCTWESSTGEKLEVRVENAAASAAEPDAVVEVRFT